MDSGLRVAVLVVLFWLLPSAEVACAQSKVNIVHPGAATWSLLLSIAQEQGLFAKHGVEVQLVSVPETDAAVLSPAQSHQLRAKGFSVLLDLYPAKIYGFQTALVVTAAYLQQHPDVVEKVVNALVEAMAFSFAPANKPTVLRTIMKLKLFNATDVASAERSHKDLADLNNSKPYPSIERLRNMQRVIALHDPKVLNLRVEGLIEDRFVRKLDENGVIDRLYGTYGVK